MQYMSWTISVKIDSKIRAIRQLPGYQIDRSIYIQYIYIQYIYIYMQYIYIYIIIYERSSRQQFKQKRNSEKVNQRIVTTFTTIINSN